MSKSGTRDSFNLMFNCRRLLSTKMNNSLVNWALACELFAVGSTSAVAICREAGIDPNSKIVTKLRQSEKL